MLLWKIFRQVCYICHRWSFPVYGWTKLQSRENRLVWSLFLIWDFIPTHFFCLAQITKESKAIWDSLNEVTGLKVPLNDRTKKWENPVTLLNESSIDGKDQVYGGVGFFSSKPGVSDRFNASIQGLFAFSICPKICPSPLESNQLILLAFLFF